MRVCILFRTVHALRTVRSTHLYVSGLLQRSQAGLPSQSSGRFAFISLSSSVTLGSGPNLPACAGLSAGVLLDVLLTGGWKSLERIGGNAGGTGNDGNLHLHTGFHRV